MSRAGGCAAEGDRQKVWPKESRREVSSRGHGGAGNEGSQTRPCSNCTTKYQWTHRRLSKKDPHSRALRAYEQLYRFPCPAKRVNICPWLLLHMPNVASLEISN